MRRRFCEQSLLYMIPWGINRARGGSGGQFQWDDRYRVRIWSGPRDPTVGLKRWPTNLSPGPHWTWPAARDAMLYGWLSKGGGRRWWTSPSGRSTVRRASRHNDGATMSRKSPRSAQICRVRATSSAFDLVMLVPTGAGGPSGTCRADGRQRGRPGGHLLVVAHHPATLSTGWRTAGPCCAVHSGGHRRGSARRWARGRDLEVERCEEVLRDVPGDSDAGPAIDALFLARRPSTQVARNAHH